MIGTVPMYDAIGYLEKDLQKITANDFMRVIEAHAKEGVDFMTIHAGINRRAVEAFRRTGRLTNIVSRGGSLIFAWMEMTGNENPFYEYYDDVLDILREYDVTISLGDALRPGSIHDSSDAGQLSELIELGALTKRAWQADVQVMVEGPGHMALNEVEANMRLQKRLCYGAPCHGRGAGIRPYHKRHRRRGGGDERRGLFMLCYPGRASALAGSTGCKGRHHSSKDRGACGGCGQRPAGRQGLGRQDERCPPQAGLGGDVLPGHGR